MSEEEILFDTEIQEKHVLYRDIHATKVFYNNINMSDTRHKR